METRGFDCLGCFLSASLGFPIKTVKALRLKNFIKITKKKMGELIFYALFLSNRNNSTTPTMTMVAIMPMTAGTKYASATDTGVGVGAGVAAGSGITARVVGAYDSS